MQTSGLYQLLINNVNPTTVNKEDNSDIFIGHLFFQNTSFGSVFHKYDKNTILIRIPIVHVLVCLECFQFESSRLLLFCSEPQLQSRSIIL